MGEIEQRQHNPSASTEGREIPKRRSWSKWVLAGLVVFYLATVAGWFYWDHKAEQMLRKEIEPVRSAGEPLEWAELEPEPVPDEQNAAPLYDRAWDALNGRLNGGEQEIDPQRRERLLSMVHPFGEYPDFRREHADDLEALLEMSQAALELCREARGRPKAYWEVDYTRPAIKMHLPPMGVSRSLARLLRVAAVTAHEQGRDDQAVAYIRDIIHVSRSVQQAPVLIAYLVRAAVSDLASRTVEEIAPDLRTGDVDGAASRQEVAALITELLKTQPLQQAFPRAMMAERSMLYDTCQTFLGKRVTEDARLQAGSFDRFLLSLLDPIVKVDQALLLRLSNVYVRAAQADDYPSAESIVSQAPDYEHIFRGNELNRTSHLLLWVLATAHGRVPRLHWNAVAVRRMSGVALAMRLFELDNGRRPESLDELVPEYLSEVPRDPFDPDAHIRYRPDDTPVLYCVGPDGVDDGGMAGEPSLALASEWPDIVFFLDGERPCGEPDWEEPTTRPARRAVPFTVRQESRQGGEGNSETP